MKPDITFEEQKNSRGILLSDRRGRVTQHDRNITSLVTRKASLLDDKEREILAHEVILQEKLNNIFKSLPLDTEIKQRILSLALLTNRFGNSADINNLEQPTKRTTIHNVASLPLSIIGIPMRISSDIGAVVMPLRYCPEERCYVCLAQEAIKDDTSGQHFLIVKVHENRLVKDFNLRKASHYFKFSFVS